MKAALVCVMLAMVSGGCISSLGYVPPAAQTSDLDMIPTYGQTKTWAYDVHAALVARAVTNRSALYVGGTFAAAASTATAALVGLGATSPALMALPLAAGFLGAAGAVYNNGPRADLYGRAAHLVMLAILASDARVTSGGAPNMREATCLRRDVFEAMYRVERHLTFLDPQNVGVLLSNVKAGTVPLTATEVKAATGDLSDLDGFVSTCDTPVMNPVVVMPLPPVVVPSPVLPPPVIAPPPPVAPLPAQPAPLPQAKPQVPPAPLLSPQREPERPKQLPSEPNALWSHPSQQGAVIRAVLDALSQ